VPAAAVCLVAAIAPFETPLLTVGAFTLTSVEAVLLAALGLSLAAILHARQPTVWKTPITIAAAACLAVFCAAAVFSSVDRGNALRFVARMMAGAAVYVLVVNAVTTREMARTVVRVLLAVGVVVSVLAVLETAQVRAVLHALTAFRPGFHVVGGQLRATSTLLYPTIASMYLEVIFALGLWLLLETRSHPNAQITRVGDPGRHEGFRGSRRKDGSALGQAVVFASLSIIAAGIIATFTRAGLIAMGCAIGVVALLRFAKTGRLDFGHARLATLAAVMGAIVLVSHSPDVLLTRLRTEGSQDWYGATYSAPPALRLRTGADYTVPIALENTGRVVWDSSSEPMFAMSYHWLRAGSESVVQFDGWRTPFPTPIEPNTRIVLPVNVRAPGEPGKYVLVWDVVHEHRAWLSTEGVTAARTLVDVEGERVSATGDVMNRLPPANSRADRFTLWQAALRIAAEYPVLGIGPDNFRTVYGKYIAGRRGTAEGRWDTRVHANNMYLEVLAGAGLLGLLAVCWLLGASATALVRQWRRAAPAAASGAAAFCAAWLVIAGHGIVDSFLSFTTTYVMFALAAGLAFSEHADADRV
jgi:hypothetical protein